MSDDPYHRCGSLVDCSGVSMSCTGETSTDWTQHSRFGFSSAEGKGHLPQPAGSAFPNAAKDTVGLLDLAADLKGLWNMACSLMACRKGFLF